jgi:hypothetical protein
MHRKHSPMIESVCFVPHFYSYPLCNRVRVEMWWAGDVLVPSVPQRKIRRGTLFQISFRTLLETMNWLLYDNHLHRKGQLDLSKLNLIYVWGTTLATFALWYWLTIFFACLTLFSPWSLCRFLFTCDSSLLIKSEVLLALPYALNLWRDQIFLASLCLDRLLNAVLVYRYYESIANLH